MSMIALIAALTAGASLQGARYDDCIKQVTADPIEGRTLAQQWVSEGGGANARHCLAIADLKAGFPKLAALRLDDIATRKDAGDDYVRARILTQAAEAWLQAGEPNTAETSLTKALELVPDSGELQLTAAKVYAALERWQAVIDSVHAAHEAGFISAETYVLRGRAYFTFSNYDEAAQDVVNALTLDPTNVAALVLRGDLQQTGIVIDVSYGEFQQNR